MGVGESKWLKRDTNLAPQPPPPISHHDGSPVPDARIGRPHWRHELHAQSAFVEKISGSSRHLSPVGARPAHRADCRQAETGHSMPCTPFRPCLSATGWNRARCQRGSPVVVAWMSRKGAFARHTLSCPGCPGLLCCPVLGTPFLPRPVGCRQAVQSPSPQSPVPQPIPFLQGWRQLSHSIRPRQGVGWDLEGGRFGDLGRWH